MSKIVTGAMVSGKASILNNKATKITSHEKDDWSRSVQVSIPMNESPTQQSSVTSINWIHAFRNQTERSQEVKIPSVKSQLDTGDDGPIPHGNLLFAGDISRTDSQAVNPQKDQNSSKNLLPDDGFLTETSVKLVQDYIDYSSATNPRTPSLPPTYRPITSVKAHHKSGTKTSPSDQRASPVKSHYSGMDKDDCISLIAPKFHSHDRSCESPTHRPAVDLPSHSFVSIHSPRTQSNVRPVRVPPQPNRSISESNSLLGIGGEFLESESLYHSAQQSMNPLAFPDLQVASSGIAVSGNSLFSPLKTQTKNSSMSRGLSRGSEPTSKVKTREIHMQLPIPSQTTTRRDDILTDSVASLESSARHHEGQSHHNSSILTKFLTSDTQHIINQYLGASKTQQKPSRPNTQNTHLYHLPHAVTPSLEVSWQDELYDQQRALRSVFQAKPRSKHQTTKPQPPSYQKTSLRNVTRNIHSAGPAKTPVNHEYHHMFFPTTSENLSVPSTARSQILRSPDSNYPTDTDSVGDIHMVLSQMSQSQVASETIKPLQRYGDSEEMIDNILDQLEAFEPLFDEKESVMKVSNPRRTDLVQHPKLPLGSAPTQPNTVPRLLLSSPRPQDEGTASSRHGVDQPPLQAKITLPAVADSSINSHVVHAEGSTLNSLSIATLPQSSESDAKKTISRRILRTHQPPSSAKRSKPMR